MDTSNTTIRTGQTDRRAYVVLENVMGQMSDGKWENTPGYEKYWGHSKIEIDKDGEVVIKIDRSYDSGFREMTPVQVRRFFARKIRAVVTDFGGYDVDPCEYLNYDYEYSTKAGERDRTDITNLYCKKLADRLSKFNDVEIKFSQDREDHIALENGLCKKMQALLDISDDTKMKMDEEDIILWNDVVCTFKEFLTKVKAKAREGL